MTVAGAAVSSAIFAQSVVVYPADKEIIRDIDFDRILLSMPGETEGLTIVNDAGVTLKSDDGNPIPVKCTNNDDGTVSVIVGNSLIEGGGYAHNSD